MDAERTLGLVDAITRYGVKYRMGKSLCVETPEGIQTLMAEDVEALVAYILLLDEGLSECMKEYEELNMSKNPVTI